MAPVERRLDLAARLEVAVAWESNGETGEPAEDEEDAPNEERELDRGEGGGGSEEEVMDDVAVAVKEGELSVDGTVVSVDETKLLGEEDDVWVVFPWLAVTPLGILAVSDSD